MNMYNYALLHTSFGKNRKGTNNFTTALDEWKRCLISHELPDQYGVTVKADSKRSKIRNLKWIKLDRNMK